MNRFFSKLIIILVIIISFSQGYVYKALGSEAEITFKDDDIIYNPDNKVFMDYSSIMPGESYNSSLTVYNESTFVYDLYLQLLIPENTPEGIKLLENIQMDISYENNVIYSGNVMGKEPYNNGSIESRYLLGIFDPEDMGKIDVAINVSEELSKENLNAYGETQWKLIAVAYEKNVGGEETVKDPDKEPDKEVEVKPGNNPKTGDEKPLVLYTILMGGTLLLSVFMYIKDRNKVKK